MIPCILTLFPTSGLRRGKNGHPHMLNKKLWVPFILLYLAMLLMLSYDFQMTIGGVWRFFGRVFGWYSVFLEVFWEAFEDTNVVHRRGNYHLNPLKLHLKACFLTLFISYLPFTHLKGPQGPGNRRLARPRAQISSENPRQIIIGRAARTHEPL